MATVTVFHTIEAESILLHVYRVGFSMTKDQYKGLRAFLLLPFHAEQLHFEGAEKGRYGGSLCRRRSGEESSSGLQVRSRSAG